MISDMPIDPITMVRRDAAAGTDGGGRRELNNTQQTNTNCFSRVYVMLWTYYTNCSLKFQSNLCALRTANKTNRPDYPISPLPSTRTVNTLRACQHTGFTYVCAFEMFRMPRTSISRASACDREPFCARLHCGSSRAMNAHTYAIWFATQVVCTLQWDVLCCIRFTKASRAYIGMLHALFVLHSLTVGANEDQAYYYVCDLVCLIYELYALQSEIVRVNE